MNVLNVLPQRCWIGEATKTKRANLAALIAMYAFMNSQIFLRCKASITSQVDIRTTILFYVHLSVFVVDPQAIKYFVAFVAVIHFLDIIRFLLLVFRTLLSWLARRGFFRYDSLLAMTEYLLMVAQTLSVLEYLETIMTAKKLTAANHAMFVDFIEFFLNECITKTMNGVLIVFFSFSFWIFVFIFVLCFIYMYRLVVVRVVVMWWWWCRWRRRERRRV